MDYPTYDSGPDVSRETSGSPAAVVYATLADLTNPPVAVTEMAEDFTMPSGLTVQIRPLLRSEVMAINKMQGLATEQKEQKYLAAAMVLPRMSENDVRLWQQRSVAGGDMEPLTRHLQLISGMTETGEKAAAKEFPG